MLRLLMIGHGPIAGYVAERLSGRDDARITDVLCRPGREDAARAALGSGVICATDADDVDVDQVDLAVDCAGHAGLRRHGTDILEYGLDLLTLSVGALADTDLADRLDRASDYGGGGRLELVSGAIGGIDILSAARVGGLDRVTYLGRKPPGGWAGTPAETTLDLATLTEPAEHFRGSAREAARRYPKNANVAAMVALAGIGMDETQARLIADPTVTANRHEVEAVGAFGRFRIEVDGATLPDNPRSSALAAMSMVRAIERRLARLVY